jgi:ribosomal protein S18 acetylase RimI-like enzyme
MANYNTFLVVDCNTRKPIIATSSARKAEKELRKGTRIEVWNNNELVIRIYEADRNKQQYHFMPYLKAERDYIREKQSKAERRNRMRRMQKRCDVNG